MESSTENLSSATPPSRTENLDKPGHIRGSSLSSPPPPLSSSSANVLRSLPPSVPSAPPSKRSSASASQVSLPFPTHNRGNSVSTFGDVAASGDDLFAVERPSGEAEREEDDEDVGGESKSKTTDVVDQLGILALSARMTEVDMMVQEVSLLLFEIQEIRHASSDGKKPELGDEGAADGAGPPGSSASAASAADLALTPVDRALMKLNKRLESTSQEVTALESSLAPYLSSSTSSSPDLDFLREKWDDLFSSWNRVDRSSENLRDELKEDAWLTVFRSASKQAEEMMESLEKVLSSAQEFVWEVGRRRKGKERMRGGEAGAFGEEEGEELMKAHQALVKSFDTKRKYYVPATERVLRMLDKGIEERRTKNGEVLRRSGAMKARFKSIHDRLARTERDLNAIESILSEPLATITPSGSIASSLDTSQRTPSRDPSGGGDERFLSPDSNPRSSIIAGTKAGSSPGTVSPFRRFVNKMTPSRPFSPSAHSSPDLASQASGSPSATPSRPSLYARARLRTRESAQNMRGKSVTPVPPVPGSALRAVSAGNDVPTVKGKARGRESVLKGRMSTSGSVAGDDHRPPWNISLRKEQESQPPTTATPQKKRSGLPIEYASPPGPGSSVYSPMRSRSRPSSVMPPAPSMDNFRRATSPSVMSDDSTHTRQSLSSSYRPRQSVGGGASKIPTPAWAVTGTPSRSVTPSLTNMSYEYEEVLGNDDPPTSLMQRAMSPAPSSVSYSAQSVSTSPGGTSRIPLPASRARSTTPNPSLRSSVYGGSGTPTHLGSSLGPGYSPSARSSLSASTGGGKRAFSPTASDIAMMPRWNSSTSARSHTPEPGVALKAQKVSSTYRNTPSRLDTRRPSSRLSLGASTNRPASKMQMRSGHPPLPGANGHGSAYEANALDPLDVKVSQIVAAQPLLFAVQRVDAPLSRADVGSGVGDQARYIFVCQGQPDATAEKAVMCKLTARVMPKTKERVERVLCRVKGGWIDLDLYLLEKQAQDTF